MNQQNTIKRVKSDLRGFDYAFSCLPSNQIKPIRKELMKKLHWSISNFYYKKSGRSQIWKYEKAVIVEVLKRFGIDVRKSTPITK